MKRIEMTVASCGECPFSENEYATCSNPLAKGSAAGVDWSMCERDGWNPDSAVHPDCPLPDAEPE